jgi:hypothetical protein
LGKKFPANKLSLKLLSKFPLHLFHVKPSKTGKILLCIFFRKLFFGNLLFENPIFFVYELFQCCYGRGAAKNMSIESMDYLAAYHYELQVSKQSKRRSHRYGNIIMMMKMMLKQKAYFHKMALQLLCHFDLRKWIKYCGCWKQSERNLFHWYVYCKQVQA